MRTFVAFKFHDELHTSEYLEKIENVKNFYESQYLRYSLNEQYSFHKNLGIFVLDDINSKNNFPTKTSYDNQDILMFSPPLNYNSEETKNRSVISMIEKLSENDNYIFELDAPFLFASIDFLKEEINIFTDILGVSRLYELKTNEGTFWSNRPTALHIFSDHYAELDQDSWKLYGVSGWFMDDDSPFNKVKRMPPASRIKIGIFEPHINKTFKNSESLLEIINRVKSKNIDLNYMTQNIISNLKNFYSLWNLKPEVDISGGKDSRVGLATVICSYNEKLALRTIKDIDKELITAQQLLSKIDNTYELRILNPELYIENQPNLIDRVDRLLFEHDGDFSTVMISSPIVETNQFYSVNKVTINGFGGEVSKGAYYSNERWLTRLSELGENAALIRLSSHYQKIGCVPDTSIDMLVNKLKKIISNGKSIGITNLNLLDYFYFIERFRRWSPLSGQTYSYSPFINKYYIGLAILGTPEENLNTSIHKHIINSLLPQWKNIDFFKATPEESKEKDSKELRLWQTKDKTDIEKILSTPDEWNDIFLKQEVISLWNEAITKGIPNFKETLFHRVALRTQFNKHLNRINKYIDTTKENTKMHNNFRVFNPVNDNIKEEVRLIIYDNDTNEYIVKEVIKAGSTYEAPEKLFVGNWDYKYKYQTREGNRWVDIATYRRLVPEQITDDGIKYLYYPNPDSNKLVVVFQAINTRQSYNYIKVLKNHSINKLFIKDDYGLDELTKSSYYLGTKKNLNIAEGTQNLISRVIKENGFSKENIIFAGSSKGGYAALYHGYKIGGVNIIPGGPQVMLGDYLYQTNPKSIRYEIFKSIVGDFTEENKNWANNQLFDVLSSAELPYPKTKIHIGLGEPHFEEHVTPFQNWINDHDIPNVQIEGQDYSTHEELATYYPIFLDKEIKNFINQ